MKAFLSTLAGIVVIALLAILVIGVIFWSRLPDIVASHISKKLKVSVEIDSFGLGWGKLSAKKIQIGNPPGSILSRAFACDEIDVLAPFGHYLKTQIVINEIDLSNVYLGLEFDSATATRGNWTTIMGNLKQAMGNPPSSSEHKKEARSVLIHRIVLTNIDVDVVYKKDSGKVKKLPRIERLELTEISSQGGIPMDQILNSVLGEMLKQVFLKENLKNMMQEFMETPGTFQKYLAPFTEFLGEN